MGMGNNYNNYGMRNMGMSNWNGRMMGNMRGNNYNNYNNWNNQWRNGGWNSNNFGMGNMNGMNNMMNMNMDRKHPQTTYNDADFAVRATVMDKDEINYQYRINIMEIYKHSDEMNWEEAQSVF